MTFTASPAPQPPSLSLRAKLSWHYFFEAGWEVVHTGDGPYIVTDEALELENATLFPDEDAFVSWLETVCCEHLNDDPVGFLQNFVSIPELINEEVASIICSHLD